MGFETFPSVRPGIKESKAYSFRLESLDRKNVGIQEKINNLEKLDSNSAGIYRRKWKNLKRWVSGILQILLINGIVSEGIHHLTRYEVDKVEGSEISFQHEDPETTNWINYLSGKSSLPENMRLSVFRGLMRSQLEYGSIAIPKEFDGMNYEELRGFLLASGLFGEVSIEHYQKDTNSLRNDWVPERYPSKAGVYTALWEIEEKAGNPKIRQRPSGRASYDQFRNTIYISPMGLSDNTGAEAIRQFISESSHGVQFHEAHLTSYPRILQDVVFRVTGLGEIGYKMPGTIEHEAHSSIQPKLQEHYDKRVRESNLTNKQSKKQKYGQSRSKKPVRPIN